MSCSHKHHCSVLLACPSVLLNITRNSALPQFITLQIGVLLLAKWFSNQRHELTDFAHNYRHKIALKTFTEIVQGGRILTQVLPLQMLRAILFDNIHKVVGQC